jgi:hypothetical protein
MSESEHRRLSRTKSGREILKLRQQRQSGSSDSGGTVLVKEREDDILSGVKQFFRQIFTRKNAYQEILDTPYVTSSSKSCVDVEKSMNTYEDGDDMRLSGLSGLSAFEIQSIAIEADLDGVSEEKQGSDGDVNMVERVFIS